jgi:hypothetical protein
MGTSRSGGLRVQFAVAAWDFSTLLPSAFPGNKEAETTAEKAARQGPLIPS